MIGTQKVVVVMPGYQVERTLERAYRALPLDLVDEVIVVDDASRDRTSHIAKQLGVLYCRHDINQGYGGSQKTGYRVALDRGADIVVMVHADDQYPAEYVPALARMIASGECHVALGSRMLDRGMLQRGMPRYRYVCNRLWTWVQNRCLGQRLAEYHTGFRAFSRAFLRHMPLLENSDDFLFDNQVILQAIHWGYPIGEVPVPARYTEDSSSMSPWRGIRYGLGILVVTGQYLLHRSGIVRVRMFDPQGKRLLTAG